MAIPTPEDHLVEVEHPVEGNEEPRECFDGISTEKKRAKLAKKIEEIAVSMDKITKDGENQHSHYFYISAEQIDKELRTLFKKNKISIFPSMTDYFEKEFEGVNSNGKPNLTIRTVVKMEFEMIDHETGFSTIKTFFGGDQDVGGKSFGQASTQCTKDFYRKLFRISDSKESEGDRKTTNITRSSQPSRNLGKCGKCGAQNRLSKAGKTYCGKTCWKDKEE